MLLLHAARAGWSLVRLEAELLLVVHHPALPVTDRDLLVPLVVEAHSCGLVAEADARHLALGWLEFVCVCLDHHLVVKHIFLFKCVAAGKFHRGSLVLLAISVAQDVAGVVTRRLSETVFAFDLVLRRLAALNEGIFLAFLRLFLLDGRHAALPH